MKLFNTIIICMSACLTVQAADYDAAVRQVLDRGYGLHADSLRMQAAVAGLRADNMPEGPEAEFEYLWPSHDGRARWSASVSQSFDWPGLYGARRRQAESEAASASAVMQSITLDKAMTVKQSIIDIINARRRLALYESIGRNLDSLDAMIAKAYELEAANILDRRKMQIAVLDSRREIAALRADLITLTASLEAQGATVGADWTEYPAQAMVSPSDDPLDYPEYRVMAASQRAAADNLSVARRSALPGFSLGYVHAFEDGTHFNGLSVSVSLPSWSTASRRRAAQLEAEAVAADGTAQFVTAMAEQRALYESARVLSTDMAAYRQLTGDDSYLSLLMRAYLGGELTVIDYLNEINLFTRARLSYIDLEYRYNLTLVRLNRTRGIGF